jgi:hypothetical protein
MNLQEYWKTYTTKYRIIENGTTLQSQSTHGHFSTNIAEGVFKDSNEEPKQLSMESKKLLKAGNPYKFHQKRKKNPNT